MSAHNDRSVLVLGGARSGKSRFAELLAEKTGLQKVYVATAAAGDGEMRMRIAQHRQQRGDGWHTIEEQLALADVIANECAPERVLLFDCLTLWLSNMMMAERDLEAETAALCAVIGSAKGPLVMVSNEVGLSIVPENALARAFRDAQGRLNQSLAEVSGKVVFVAAGLPILLKPAQQPEISL